MIELEPASDARFGIVRSISYGLFGPPDTFVPEARKLGAEVIRIYLYWGQIQPEPGALRFDIVDTFLEQLDGTEEVWVTVCSSSPWATTTSTTFIPSSPAKDDREYDRFVRALVEYCKGRVHYWQCDNEPSNLGLLWTGSADEYARQLQTMYRAVKDIDPAAMVVLGGMPFNVPSSDPAGPERHFFDDVLRASEEAFDVFDLHLYQPIDRIPADVALARTMMRTHGYEKPIVAGEYNAPWPELFPQATTAMHEAMAEVFKHGGTAGGEAAAVQALYDRMDQLPPQLQMFMRGCPPELDAKRDRINAREIVMRNVVALACGIRRTLCWDLAPDIPNYRDDLSVLDILFGKLVLMSYEGTELRPNPPAESFRLMAEQLKGAHGAERVGITDRPAVHVYDVRRSERPDLWVVWDERDAFNGEDEPAVPIRLPWPAESATAVDAFGRPVNADVADGQLKLLVSVDPIFVERA
jgi:hypothetical protein